MVEASLIGNVQGDCLMAMLVIVECLILVLILYFVLLGFCHYLIKKKKGGDVCFSTVLAILFVIFFFNLYSVVFTFHNNILSDCESRLSLRL